MKNDTILLFLFFLAFYQTNAQKTGTIFNTIKPDNMEVLKTKSHINNLEIAVNYIPTKKLSNDYPVLFLHGSSFPTALSFGFKMNNESWMTNLSENGYDVFALDFLGYGNSDRYPEMENNFTDGKVVGRGEEVVLDVDKAIEFIRKKTGKNKVYLIGHSWGGSVAALYASKFPEKIEKLVLFAAITIRNEDTKEENIKGSFAEMTAKQRIDAMESLTPKDKSCELEKEVFTNWSEIWENSDPLFKKLKTGNVRFPSGPNQDIEDLMHNKPYYNPEKIKAQTLIIRGSWDQYPNNSDAENLLISLKNAKSKKYIILDSGTHVAHLETSRNQLYQEVLLFLKRD
ncbi:pimeloyl-ACP methyl ester carboxylesterase [Flavobacterium sp. 270]|uniref:alpha/beta hydrolase n=1 Tax=Flavobacterium sp. 270 TaxID=2512114 RepID=UPI00106602FE|nr:alpha/beta hydrolase [Flavobacterium sp. 270]TDW48931.1 pimeloyl-ACP methyl ester carboxylesterase [Flavobacterium sp. 270]